MNPQPKRWTVKLSESRLAKLRATVRKLDGEKCVVCGWPAVWQTDGRMRTHLEANHVIPRSRQRLDVEGNLATVCAPACHDDITQRRITLRWVEPEKRNGVELAGPDREIEVTR